MSIVSALNVSTRGLNNAEKGLEIVSRNIANAGEEGYHKEDLVSIESHSGNHTSVREKQIQRSLDRILQRQLIRSTSEANEVNVQMGYYERLEVALGAPGSEQALDTLLNHVTSSLDELVTSPESQSARMQALASFEGLSNQLNLLTDEIQSMRQDVEYHIEQNVNNLNGYLKSLHDVNQNLNAHGGEVSALTLDERDRLVHKIAELVDVTVHEGRNNTVHLTTRSGLTILSELPSEFSFEARDHFTPMTQYDLDPDLSHVGAITVRTGVGSYQDITHDRSLHSGSIYGLVELRDSILVDAQAQMDEVAANLALALSSYEVEGAALTVGAAEGFSVDVSSMQPGNHVNVQVTDNGQDKVFQFVHVTDPAGLPYSEAVGNLQVIGVDFTDMATAVSDIQAAMGANFTVTGAGTTLNIVDDGAAALSDVKAADAIVSAQTISGENQHAVPVFIDSRTGKPYNGAIGDPGDKLGIAGYLVVNPELKQDDTGLVIYNTPANFIGDKSRPEHMIEALTSRQMTIAATNGLGNRYAPLQTNVRSLVHQVINAQSQTIESADRSMSNKELALTAIESRYNEKSGVSIDEEMAKLLTLQNTYSANARVMQVAKEMFERLLQI